MTNLDAQAPFGRGNSAGATHKDWIISVDDPVLVTGSGGFIGRSVVSTLLAYGFRHVRCLVRSSQSVAQIEKVARSHDSSGRAVEIVKGNLLVPKDCERAAAGASVVFHLAAGIGKSFAGCFLNSVLATRNLLDALLPGQTLKRFVNVSSFAVYSNLRMKRGSLLDESADLESEPRLRHDPYGYGKLKQEKLVESYHREFGVPYVILRPGAVYGPGRPGVSGRVGVDTFGVFLHLGGSNPIPLTYVDNCAEAIALAGLVHGVDGHVFNVVDDELPSSRRFLRLYKRHAGRFASIPVPYPLAYLLCTLWELYSERSSGQLPPSFNRRRCAAEWKGNRYSNQKLKEMVGWGPRVPFNQASKCFFDSLRVPR